MRTLWMVGCGCFLVFGAAAAGVQTASPLQGFLKMEGIDNGYTINYLDEQHHPLSADAFSASIGQGRSFDFARDNTVHVVTLTLQPKSVAATPGKSLTPAEQKAVDRFVKEGAAPHFLKVGQALPPFRLKTVEGQIVDNAALRGHETLINFYFSECGPCIAETPALVAYAKQHPQHKVLAITFDDTATTATYASDHHFSWPILTDAQSFIAAMGVNEFPVLALVGPDGRLLKIGISSGIGKKANAPTADDVERWVTQPADHPAG